MKPPSTSCYGLLARDGGRAVILRRGPSRQVALVAWDRARDRFEVGQWLKGRIYEHRCDLSPKGDLLIYFAATWKRRHAPGTWTAISRPPYLTALTLWPKGDTWGGGGMFRTATTVALNHGCWPDGVPAPAEPTRLPKRFRVLPHTPGVPGDWQPLEHALLTRDGWTPSYAPLEAPLHPNVYRPPVAWRKPSPRSRPRLELERRIIAVGQPQEPWMLVDHAVSRQPAAVSHQPSAIGLQRSAAGDGTNHEIVLPRTDWADWDANGDLLFSTRGRINRWPARAVAAFDTDAIVELIDLAPLKFEPREAPLDARAW